jgi:hypothetical protein
LTAQINDVFKFNGVEYVVVGIDGPELFDPVKEGFKPKTASTACWRGFYLTFEATDMYLYLNEMSIRQDEAKIFKGKKPTKGDLFFTHKYENLKYKLPFTGRIIIAKDFIDSMYVHMGFQRALAYKTVIELVIKEGDILEVKDHSDMYEQRRNKDPNEGAEPKSPADEDISGWISDTFSRKFDAD